MEEGDNSHHQSKVSGSLRTRSQVAPDWSVQESLILVNEINAIEAECGNTLSSFQKWKIIVENCNALEVLRSLNQCRRKWDTLLSEYKGIKQWESKSRAMSYWSLDIDTRNQIGLPESFDNDLFKAIDCHMKAQQDRSYADPDSDPEPGLDVLEAAEVIGSKKQRRRLIPQKCCVEERMIKVRRGNIDGKINVDECSLEENVEPLRHGIDGEIIVNMSIEEKEQTMAAKVQENAGRIHAILKGNMTDDLDYVEACETDFTRRQGDTIIACLANLADTLDKLCDIVQECH